MVLQPGLCLYSYYLVTKGQALSLPTNRYILRLRIYGTSRKSDT
ncbi:hypothetical protein WI0192307A01_CDS0032 [Salmonella phage VT223]